jgi:hypothetical protein
MNEQSKETTMNASTTHRCLIETLETRRMMSSSGPNITEVPTTESVSTIVPLGRTNPRTDLANNVVDLPDSAQM